MLVGMDVFDSLPEAIFSAMLRLVLEKVGDAALILDQDMRIVFANEAFQRATGFSSEQIESGHWRNNVDQTVLMEIKHAMGDGRWSWKGKIPGMRSSGYSSAFEAEVFALDTDGDGRTRHFAAVMRETSDLDRQLAALQEGVVFMEQLLDAIPNAVSVKDVDGRYVTCNQAFEELVRLRRHAIVGRRGQELGVFDPSCVEIGEALERNASEGEPSSRRHGTLTFLDGRETEVLLWIVGFRRRDGSPGGSIAVFVDITDLREKERELAAARERAEAEMRSKAMFLANMSHEIRTPLNALVGLSHLLGRMELGPRQREHAEKIQTAGLALRKLVDDVLDFTRIEDGRIEFGSLPFRMQDVLRMQEVLFEEKARAKGVGFVAEADPELVHPLFGDAMRIGQILTNLVGNAVKFTASGEVVLDCRIVDHREDEVLVRFSVTDSGIGMEEDQIAVIFEPFRQGDGSITRRFGGTGLGLSISRKLVELMGGRLQVRSVAGEGSTFHFELWLRKASESSEPADSMAEGGSSYEVDRPLRDLKILLVEDDEMNRMTASDLLAADGANVVAAADGKQALEILDRESGDFDIVLMDLEMPVMGGLETTRRMKASPLLCAIPVVAMTAYAEIEDWKAYQEAGMLEHVAKPFDLDALRDTILRRSRRAFRDDSSQDSEEGGTASAGVELDRQRGLRKARGDERMYGDALSRFLKEQGNSLVEIGSSVAEGARFEARLRARGLRAAAGMIGATTLQRKVRRLEDALAGDGDVPVRLASAARSLMKLVREIFEAIEEPNEAEESGIRHPPPDEASLGRLRELLRCCDGEALDLYESMEGGVRSWLGRDMARDLGDALRSFDFDKAQRILDQAGSAKGDA